MTGLDWIIVVFALLLAAYGYGQGFVIGAFSLAGFVAGAWLGSRIGPELLPEGSRSPYAPLFGLAGALVAGALLAGGLEGIGRAVRGTLRLPGFAALDGLLGAMLTGGVALALAWVLGAVALTTPGARQLRAEVQRSAILRQLNEWFPPSGPLLRALARFDPFPRFAGPGADVAPPRAAIARDPEVRRASQSVVRIVGTACGLGVEGSGWVAAPGIVVTNAHVVAGQEDTQVQPDGSGPHLDARALAFDPDNDVAVLAVPALGRPALPLDPRPRSGTAAAVLGYPENGPFDVRAARIGAERTVISENAYGQGRVRRTILPLRGLVRPGNSGGPLVDGEGEVVGTVFAAAVGGDRAGYAVPNSIVRRALREAKAGREVSTGPCGG